MAITNIQKIQNNLKLAVKYGMLDQQSLACLRYSSFYSIFDEETDRDFKILVLCLKVSRNDNNPRWYTREGLLESKVPATLHCLFKC